MQRILTAIDLSTLRRTTTSMRQRRSWRADGAAVHNGSQPLHNTASDSDSQGLVAEKLVSVGAVPDVRRQDRRRPLSLVGATKVGLREALLIAGAVAV